MCVCVCVCVYLYVALLGNQSLCYCLKRRIWQEQGRILSGKERLTQSHIWDTIKQILMNSASWWRSITVFNNTHHTHKTTQTLATVQPAFWFLIDRNQPSVWTETTLTPHDYRRFCRISVFKFSFPCCTTGVTTATQKDRYSKKKFYVSRTFIL